MRTSSKAFIVFVLAVAGTVLIIRCVFGQAPRPPISTLGGLNDVTINTPLDGQALVQSSGKWINGNGLTDIVVFNSADALSAADFSSYLLSNKNGIVLDWSDAVKFSQPLADTNDLAAIDISNRLLYGTDGSTIRLRWDGVAVKIPYLADGWLKVQSGDGTLATVSSLPGAGTIPATLDVLVGDNAGNAVPSNMIFAKNTDNSVLISKTISAGDTSLTVINPAATGGATSSLNLSGITLDPGLQLRHYDASFGTTGLIQNGDNSVASAFGRLIISGNNYILFATDGLTLATERMRLGNGLAVGTTTDPGAGVVNVSSGFRIGNAAAQFKSLVGNGTSFVSGDVPGKASVTSTVDQTATTETAHVVYTVPANSVSAGTTFRITAWGDMDNGTTQITFTPRLRWGGTGGTQLLATPTVVSTTSSRTNATWKAVAHVTIRTTGATGTAVAESDITDHTSSTAVTDMWEHEANSGGTAVTIDTTANKDLDLTWALSSTTGTPHVRTFGGTIEVVKP